MLDDWGPEPLNAEQRRDLLEIVEDRYDARSIMITSQVPVDRWYEIIGDPTLADAILDRLVHNAYRIELSGDSLRKKTAPNRPLDLPTLNDIIKLTHAGDAPGGRLQFGIAAGFRLECMAGFVGIRSRPTMELQWNPHHPGAG